MTPAERRRAAGVIRGRMAELDLTATELAEKADVSPSTIRRILKGQHSASDETRQRIAGALGWEVGEVLRRMSGVDLSAVPTELLLDELRARCG